MSRLELIEERHLTFQAAYLQYWIQFPPQDAEDLWREDTEEFIEAHAAEPIAVTDDFSSSTSPPGPSSATSTSPSSSSPSPPAKKKAAGAAPPRST